MAWICTYFTFLVDWRWLNLCAVRYDHISQCISRLLTEQPRKCSEGRWREAMTRWSFHSRRLDRYIRRCQQKHQGSVQWSTRGDWQRASRSTFWTCFSRRTEAAVRCKDSSFSRQDPVHRIFCFSLKKPENAEELDEEALQSPLPHLLQQAYYFEQAGIGMGRDETYRWEEYAKSWSADLLY